MNPAPEETRRFTIDEVLAMAEAGIFREDERLELLEGQLVVVPPEEPPHADIVSRLNERLVTAYAGRHAVRIGHPLTLGADTLPQPDVAVVRRIPEGYGARHPRGDEAILVVEISRTTLRRDHGKATLYARAGVPVYWIVDVQGRRLEVHTEPHPDGHYGLVVILDENKEVTAPDLEVRWRVRDLL